MFLATATLAQLLHACAPSVSPRTMAAIVTVESGGNTLALHDNTLRYTYEPSSTAQAILWAGQLIARGDSVDIGLSQINSANLPSLGLSVKRAFDPCTNISAGATILGNDYASTSAQFGPGQYALRRALSEYNSGSPFAAPDYVNRILIAAGVPPDPPPPMAKTHDSLKAIAVATPTPPYTIERVTGSDVEVINGHP